MSPDLLRWVSALLTAVDEIKGGGSELLSERKTDCNGRVWPEWSNDSVWKGDTVVRVGSQDKYRISG